MIDAFILGAGFSIAVNELSFPSTDVLGHEVLAILMSRHRNSPGRHSDICDGISCDFPVLVEDQIPTEDGSFETWLSRLSEPQPFLLSFENARNAALFEQITAAIYLVLQFAVSNAFEEEPPDWLVALVRAWHRNETDVLTFNYDPVIEATVEWSDLRDPDDRKVAYQLLGPAVSLMPYWNALTGGVPVQSLRLYKMHGSLTWYWDEQTRSPESMIDVGPQLLWHGATDGGPEPAVRAPGRVPVIVPPTFSKNPFLENRVIRTVWRKGFEALRKADRIFIVGYSLPPGDLLVRSMLSEALSVKPTDVWIVNPDEEVAKRFGDFAGRIDTTFCHSAVSINEFVDWYIA